jgi:hypothetical protein
MPEVGLDATHCPCFASDGDSAARRQIVIQRRASNPAPRGYPKCPDAFQLLTVTVIIGKG